jgi:hypothetical protein
MFSENTYKAILCGSKKKNALGGSILCFLAKAYKALLCSLAVKDNALGG